jgi:hybrid cluster-associated redox disulfide protein
MKIDAKTTINDLLSYHPAAINVFIQRKMLCVGCPVETFHTIADAARLNGIALHALLKEVHDVIDAPHGP